MTCTLALTSRIWSSVSRGGDEGRRAALHVGEASRPRRRASGPACAPGRHGSPRRSRDGRAAASRSCQGTRCSSEAGGSHGWCGSGNDIQQNHGSSAPSDVEPVDGQVGHPVGVVPLPRDRVVLRLGRRGVAARLGLEQPGEAVQVLGVVLLEPAAVVRDGVVAPGGGVHGLLGPLEAAPGSGVAPGHAARSPRTGSAGRSRARSAPCPAGRCGSPPRRAGTGPPRARRPGAGCRWPRRRACGRTGPSAWSSAPACTPCSGCRRAGS